ncbi:MAG TPA: peptidoglycan-associated lipoprotein Pal [Deltaproteobacteria bacterium]|nr:peptidoglycan-associated lipoprotein Pal [Deltaproteobacteria bacterium]
MLAEESVEEAYGEKLGMAEPAAPAEPEEKAPRRYAAITPGGELTEQVEEMGRLYTIYFDFDRYTIKEEYADDLAKNAAWLIKNRDVRVRLEGHADERGDVEYNLALGQKRAESVKRYLVRLGVDPSRLSTLSYGEEKPAVPGHNEEAWARNRRVEFHVLD